MGPFNESEFLNFDVLELISLCLYGYYLVNCIRSPSTAQSYKDVPLYSLKCSSFVLHLRIRLPGSFF